MEERIERTEAYESIEVNMEVMDNASRMAVISTVEGEMVKARNSKVERKKLRMVKEVERLREKRAAFYRSGSELAWQVIHIVLIFILFSCSLLFLCTHHIVSHTGRFRTLSIRSWCGEATTSRCGLCPRLEDRY